VATDIRQAENLAFDYFQKSQDAFTRTMNTWLETWTDLAHAFTPDDSVEPRPFSANAMVDRFYDTWEEILEVQRKFAHSVIDATTSTFQDIEQAADETVQKAE
jgi:hypothetical protein